MHICLCTLLAPCKDQISANIYMSFAHSLARSTALPDEMFSLQRIILTTVLLSSSFVHPSAIPPPVTNASLSNDEIYCFNGPLDSPNDTTTADEPWKLECLDNLAILDTCTGVYTCSRHPTRGQLLLPYLFHHAFSPPPRLCHALLDSIYAEDVDSVDFADLRNVATSILHTCIFPRAKLPYTGGGFVYVGQRRRIKFELGKAPLPLEMNKLDIGISA